MISSVSPYMRGYKKYTAAAVVLASAGIAFSIIPYYFLYQLIVPLVERRPLAFNYILGRVGLIAACEFLYGVL